VAQTFISYKREDELRVGRLARALEQAGVNIWWDRGLPGGESWHANIETHLDAAGCVVVIWSNGSVAPEGNYVRDEARRGLNRGLLVPVLIDRLSQIPLGFGEIQAIDLSRWKGDARDPFFQDLVAAIRAKLAGEPVPKPKGPTARVARQLLLGGAPAASLVALGALAFNVFGVAGALCTFPPAQPGGSDMCGALGIGGRPSKTERLAWEALPAGSCPALRDFVRRFPDGAYRREAADLITARRTRVDDGWIPVTRSLALDVVAGGPAAGATDIAKARALERARGDAERLCRGFGAGTLFRFTAATPRADRWDCQTGPGGSECGFEGTALCALQQRAQTEHETCGPTP
jgi:hypothetical protein